nr:HAD-IA family hydrolase [uncultured Cohaesibacter sp.]
MTKLVLFDVDGTLLDSRIDKINCVTELFQNHGLAVPSADAILGATGLTLDKYYTRLLGPEHAHLTAQLCDEHNARKASEQAAGRGLDPLFEGGRDVLDQLKARDDIILGIATGKSSSGVNYMLSGNGILDYFEVIETADTAPSKPDPTMLTQAREAVKLAADRTVLIGDAQIDMHMAHNAGVHCVGVSWGFHTIEQLKDAGAEAIVEDWKALIPAIEILFDQTKRS